jgi:hypothetical protein
VQGIAHGQAAHGRHEALQKAISHRVGDDEALGGDARLSVVDQAGFDGGGDGALEVRALEHHERIASAQLQDRLLQRAAGGRRHLASRGVAPGQGHRRHAIVGDEARDRVRAHQQHLEHPGGRTCAPEQILERQRALGDAGGVLEQRHVPRGQRRRSEPHHLPEREVPGHHCQDGAERLVPDGLIGTVHDLGRQERLRVPRVVPAAERALGGLVAPGADRFSHLAGRQLTKGVLLRVEQVGGPRQHRHARREVGAAPRRGRRRGLAELGLHGVAQIGREPAQGLSRGGVHADDSLSHPEKCRHPGRECPMPRLVLVGASGRPSPLEARRRSRNIVAWRSRVR